MSLLKLENFQVTIGGVQVVRDLSISLDAGECRALVGESGCGKSLSAMSLLGLAPKGSEVAAGCWQFGGQDMRGLSERDWRTLRGNRIAMIFQNPMTALNPTQRIGEQIAEPLRVHKGMSRRGAAQRAIELLERLAIPDAAKRATQYPFEFSGGMLQRAMIAMATACEPALLIADEPTTALDVTVQAEVLSLLKELQESHGTAMLFITHDLGVVANIADTVSVMYAGQSVETGSLSQVFSQPGHPYTDALKQAVPRLHDSGKLIGIAGAPPDFRQLPAGCSFGPRCQQRMAICGRDVPVIGGVDHHQIRCWARHPDRPQRGDVSE